MKSKDSKEPVPFQGFNDAINKDRFMALLGDFIKESSDEQAVELWKMITDKYPALALKVILDKIEKAKDE